MPARLSALLVWALVAASVVAWGLHLFARGPGAPANTVTVGDSVAAGGDLTRLLGAAPVVVAAAAPVPAMASRFQLTGVVAPKPPGTQGIALIAVDGKVPRAFVVGATVDGSLALQSVDRRSASIGSAGGAAAVVLEMPPLPVAATGVLVPARGDEPVNTFPQAMRPQAAPAFQVPASPVQSFPVPSYPAPSAQGQAQMPPQMQPQIQMGVQSGLQNQDTSTERPHAGGPDSFRRQPGVAQ